MCDVGTGYSAVNLWIKIYGLYDKIARKNLVSCFGTLEYLSADEEFIRKSFKAFLTSFKNYHNFVGSHDGASTRSVASTGVGTPSHRRAIALNYS